LEIVLKVGRERKREMGEEVVLVCESDGR
jgi:hypothetical protein